MGARKANEFPKQLLSLKAVRVDHSIQSRVETSLEYQREFGEAMLRGDMFPPVVVFFDGKVYWLADGFHRYGAVKTLARADPRKFGGILAEVRPGTRRDAMIFSAGANQKFSIPRTKEDMKKAVYLLLDDEEWFGCSSRSISQHCGISNTAVGKYRIEHSIERGLSIPDLLVDRDGKPRRRTTVTEKDRTPPIYAGTKSNRPTVGRFQTTFQGKRIHLGASEGAAKEKLDLIMRDIRDVRQTVSTISHITNFLSRRVNIPHRSVTIHPTRLCLYGVQIGDIIFTNESFDSSSSAPAAVGRILMLRQHVDPSARAVVVCYPEDGPAATIDLARQLGVEFLTPEELVASLKPEGEPAPPSDGPPAGEDSPP